MSLFYTTTQAQAQTKTKKQVPTYPRKPQSEGLCIKILFNFDLMEESRGYGSWDKTLASVGPTSSLSNFDLRTIQYISN